MDQALLDKIKQLVLSLLSGRGVELVDLLTGRERGRFILRFSVDKSTGITLDECARLNREISQILDEEDIIQESCIVEVSSPGLDRPMKSTRDFKRSLGKLVNIVLHQSFNGQNVWKGFLDEVDGEFVTIRTEKEKTLRIARENIAWAKLEIKID